MTQKNQIYKCEICGNIVEILHIGAGELVCCNQPMSLQIENTQDAAQEKHLPVIEKQSDSVLVKIGEVDHPMTEEHYIEWIELIADGKIYRQNLELNQKPEAKFNIQAEITEVRAYCNIHGLWKS